VKRVNLALPTFAFILVTRAALAGGVGLLVSSRLSRRRRQAIGATLIAIGAVTTIPAALALVRGAARSRQPSSVPPLEPGVHRDESLRGITRFPRTADDEFVSM
jgi:hypothetical protein